jgi:hypothetical protein
LIERAEVSVRVTAEKESAASRNQRHVDRALARISKQFFPSQRYCVNCPDLIVPGAIWLLFWIA